MIASPLKWHGGKHYLAPKFWEIAKKALHTHRVEAYAGSLAFTLASDPEGYSEVVNDTNALLINFWGVLVNTEAFALFARMAQAVPISEVGWRVSQEVLADNPIIFPSLEARVELALAFFITCRQSLAGRMQDFAPLSKTRTRRGMNEQASAWLRAIEGLPEVHARLKRVAILCRPALEVISSQDGPDTLFYLDPPYLHDTRAAKDTYGNYEMDEREHKQLLETLREIKGQAMLSGYRSPLYDHYLFDWTRHDFELPNNAAGGKAKRRVTECVWANF